MILTIRLLNPSAWDSNFHICQILPALAFLISWDWHFETPMLDPTWDCIVRVPPGSVVSVIGSGLTKLCATKEAKGSWNDFVRSATYKYGNEYSALLAKLAVQLLSH